MGKRSDRRNKGNKKIIILLTVIYSIVLGGGVYLGYTLKDNVCKDIHVIKNNK